MIVTGFAVYGEQIEQWGYSPSSDSRSGSGYVGIRNPANVCYMNSIHQQLFMLPSLR